MILFPIDTFDKYNIIFILYNNYYYGYAIKYGCKYYDKRRSSMTMSLKLNTKIDQIGHCLNNYPDDLIRKN
ncbi:hypothetical protein DERP_008502 [Dermatophagoides pteronyssinus]|uniref:Uncharacterized protein n=1 Tax=Dermatophagoides pteronyssinus TaxID=6956 RepID=A0ABQ8IVE9_DERPT|nr:hypothetical protein DERP_008502 [Dermatophagoides pteronyssinus]